ncbi:hypothetical protein CLU79DRAFT_738076 [Phycomyces nitens]|nr:hypothetical protein CLU79DRAFT_738076 [Phycomyces nitens]
MMATSRRKPKTVEFHFVDMGDPHRYKKLKVAQACDFCRRRKSKCDVGIPNSGTCSSCQKHKTLCTFSSVAAKYSPNTHPKVLDHPIQPLPAQIPFQPSNPSGPASNIPDSKPSQINFYQLVRRLYLNFQLLYVSPLGHVGYEASLDISYSPAKISQFLTNKTLGFLSPEISLQLECHLFNVYFESVHPFYPILHKHSTLQLLSKDRRQIPYGLRCAIMANACHYCPKNILPADSPQSIALFFHQQANHHANHYTTNLATLQTLLLLHRSQISIDHSPSFYLESIRLVLLKDPAHLSPCDGQLMLRAHWAYYIISTLSNPHTSQFNPTISLPTSFPTPFEDELCDPGQLSTIQYFSHLCQVSLLYSKVLFADLFREPDLTPHAIKLSRDNWLQSNPFSGNRSSHQLGHKGSSNLGSYFVHLSVLYDITLMSTATNNIHPQDCSPCPEFQQNLRLFASHHRSTIQHGRILALGLSLSLQSQLMAAVARTVQLLDTAPDAKPPSTIIAQCLDTIEFFKETTDDHFVNEELSHMKDMLSNGFVENFVLSELAPHGSWPEEVLYNNLACGSVDFDVLYNQSSQKLMDPAYFGKLLETRPFDLTCQPEVVVMLNNTPALSNDTLVVKDISYNINACADSKYPFSSFQPMGDTMLYIDQFDNPITPTYPLYSDSMPAIQDSDYFCGWDTV